MNNEMERLKADRDAWRECAGKLYDELRVRGVSESVSRDGAGCIELFEEMDAKAVLEEETSAQKPC